MSPVKLPARSFDEVVAAYPAYRQSLLGMVDNCALSARFDLEGYQYTNAAQARGIMFHRYAGRLLQTLQATGQLSIPTAEALEILYEVCAQNDVPDDEVVILSQRERRYLRICAVMLAQREFRAMDKLMAVEERLYATVTYTGAMGQTIERQITGQPDALIADPPDGAVVLDWKTTRAAPPKHQEGRGKDPSEDPGGDPAHVSYEGYWQQRFYALLIMRNYPAVKHLTLREYYVVAKEAREATVTREALEHIEREIGEVVGFLDRALQGGRDSAMWAPSPGKHCSYCRRPSSCPIEREARAMEGGISSNAQAQKVAAEFVLADVVRDQARKALKARYEDTGNPIPVRSAKGRYELRKQGGTTGNFGLFVPDVSDRGPADPALDDAFDTAARR